MHPFCTQGFAFAWTPIFRMRVGVTLASWMDRTGIRAHSGAFNRNGCVCRLCRRHLSCVNAKVQIYIYICVYCDRVAATHPLQAQESRVQLFFLVQALLVTSGGCSNRKAFTFVGELIMFSLRLFVRTVGTACAT